MKKNELVAIACLLCSCCCNGTEKKIPNPDLQKELSPIQLTIDLQEKVLSFPIIKSIPELNIPESIPQNPDVEESPSTPGTDPDNLYNRINCIIYQSGKPNILVKHKQFTPQGPDFTITYDSLLSGDYHICFLVHSDKSIFVSGQTALFSKVLDTFHLFLTQEVQTGGRIIKDIALQRIVGRIEFISVDAVPKTLKGFTINVSNYQSKINLTTGNDISQNTPYTQTDTFNDSDIGKASFSHSFFTFIPAPEFILKAHLSAKNQINEVAREREANDILPLKDHIIRYTGILYTPKESDDTFALDILNGGRWDSPIDKDLEG